MKINDIIEDMSENNLNPFHPYTVAYGYIFSGREEYINKVSNYLVGVKNGRTTSFLLYGERGIGKTSLARFIESSCNPVINSSSGLNFSNSYYSVEKNQTLKDVLEGSLNNITDSLPQTALRRLSHKLGDLFKNGKFVFGAFGINATVDIDSSQNKKYRLKDQVISSLSNLIQASIVDSSKKNKKDGFLIIIDDIHNLKDLKGSAQIFRNIINTLDFRNLGYFSFLLISYEDDIRSFFEDDPSARRNFDFMKLDVMPNEEAKDLLIKGFKEAKVDFAKDILDKEVDVAGGYPHALQVLGYNLINVDTDNYIDSNDWKKAIIDSAQELQQKDFFDFYNFSGKQTVREKIMNILAISNGKFINKKSLTRVVGLNTYRALNLLVKQGAIKENDTTGQLTLQSRLLAASISFYLKVQEDSNGLYSETKSNLNKIDSKT